MVEEKDRDTATGLIIGGLGASALATTIALLIAARPAKAAPPDEKLDYLIEVLTTLVPLLAELSERQAALITALEQWLAAQGIPPTEGMEVSVLTPWVAREPDQIFSNAIVTAGTYYADMMVDCRRVKRILFKVESSLNQPVQIQIIGNTVDNKDLATNIGAAVPCPANGNISVGLAWDDWQPYVGVKITVAAAPTAGILTVWAVVQE